MRDQLLGYLLDVLEPDERRQVEDKLSEDPQLQRELELLSDSLDPLRAAEQQYEPPAGLADRACQAVQHQICAAVGTDDRYPVITPTPETRDGARDGASRWRLGDVAVAAGIFLAAALLLFPAIQRSREIARRQSCQRNLQRICLAFQQYSQNNQGYFPSITLSGNMHTAGAFAVRLFEAGYLDDRAVLICPSSTLAGNPDQVYVPSRRELSRAKGTILVRLQSHMGGSYGYVFGYIKNRRYHSPRDERRATFAVAADAPDSNVKQLRSSNHSYRGQNVLHEDGHVAFRKRCNTPEGGLDHIFYNDVWQVAAGHHANDAVIASSHASPFGKSLQTD